MEKIANIVTKSKKNSFSGLFNVVGKYEDIIPELPTLIIGWELAKKHIENIDILKKEYDNNVQWTFSKTERRCDYEDDIIQFYKFAIIKAMSKVKYIYCNPITFGYTKIKKMIDFFKGSLKKYVFLTKNSNFLFVYSKDYNTVFGVSLTFCDYIGIDKKKIIKLLKNCEFIHNTSFINSDIRRVIGNDTHYILPLYCYMN